MTWSFSAEPAGWGKAFPGAGSAGPFGAEGESVGTGLRHTHRGSEGPAATFGKSRLRPGEESEGDRADWNEDALREEGVLWGGGGATGAVGKGADMLPGSG